MLNTVPSNLKHEELSGSVSSPLKQKPNITHGGMTAMEFKIP
jgi:hypothetical protein